MTPYFTFKGINSKDYLIVNKLPPIVKPKADIDVYEIEGRNGFLTHNKGTYRGYAKPVECSLKGLDDIDIITSWLDGTGDVVFSNEPDKTYKATIINQIDIGKISRLFHSFIVIFEVQPFKHIQSDTITLTSPGAINNPGTHPSLPKIKITGSGDVNLTINDKTIELTAIGPNITVDSELMDCYRNSTLLNDKMAGEFPMLKVGENSISWTGNVSKVEITPNWWCI